MNVLSFQLASYYGSSHHGESCITRIFEEVLLGKMMFLPKIHPASKAVKLNLNPRNHQIPKPQFDYAHPTGDINMDHILSKASPKFQRMSNIGTGRVLSENSWGGDG